MLSRVSWPTAIVMIAILGSLVGCVALHPDPTLLAAVGALGTVLAGVLAKLIGDKSDPPDPPAKSGGSGVAKTLMCLALALGMMLVTLQIAACKNANAPGGDGAPDAALVEAGVAAGDGVCSFIEGIDDSGAVRVVCAIVDEIPTLIAFILTLRTATDAAAPASCAAPPTLGGPVVLPGTDFCTSAAERARAIRFLMADRLARLRYVPDAAMVPAR